MEELILLQSGLIELNQSEFFIRLLVTIGIGFVIGLEREHASLSQKEESFAGLRTFIMVALLGFTTGIFSLLYTYWILVAVFVSLSLMIIASYWISANKGQLGGTTEIAAMLTYFLGTLTLMGHMEISLALTVVIVVFLSLKVKFQIIVGRISQSELYAFIQFVIVLSLIFPFLPNANFGPYQVINPREIGWVIVLTSGAGFLGYMLMKFLGTNKGILFTGIVGGLVSSTIVTWVFSKKSRLSPEISNSCTVAILAASTIMVIRVFVWIIIFNLTLLPNLLIPLFLVFISALGATFFFYRRQDNIINSAANLPLGQPLNLREALFFGIIYTVILLVVSYANDQFGNRGIFLSSAIAGLTDIDAITISLAKIGGKTIELLTVQNAIIVATLANTIIKLGISLWTGSKSLKKNVLLGYMLIFISGLLGFLLMNY